MPGCLPRRRPACGRPSNPLPTSHFIPILTVRRSRGPAAATRAIGALAPSGPLVHLSGRKNPVAAIRHDRHRHRG